MRRGFNLAELVVALGLLSTLIVVVIGIFTGVLRGGQKSADHTSASVLADTVVLQRVQRIYDGLDPEREHSIFHARASACRYLV